MFLQNTLTKKLIQQNNELYVYFLNIHYKTFIMDEGMLMTTLYCIIIIIIINYKSCYLLWSHRKIKEDIFYVLTFLLSPPL